jgi:Fe-S-cluster containining protein
MPKKVSIPIRAKSAPKAPKKSYDCAKCPGYCCSYQLIEINKRDISRLARHFELEYTVAEERFTKYDASQKARVLRHRKDTVFKTICMFFDQKERRCTVYESRPGVCRDYPLAKRCGYYDFLEFERDQQDDPDYIALT